MNTKDLDKLSHKDYTDRRTEVPLLPEILNRYRELLQARENMWRRMFKEKAKRCEV